MELCNGCKGELPVDGATVWKVGKCEKCGREGGVSEFPQVEKAAAAPKGKGSNKAAASPE